MKRTADGGWRRLVPRAAVFAALLISLVATLGVVKAQAAKNGKVLILGSTVTGGASSDEAKAAEKIGLGVDVVDNATWASMTTAQFASYEALILGDPTCTGLGSGAATATANSAVWGPAIDGNVIMIGTDEVYHRSQGGLQVSDNLVKFASFATGAPKTGMMISLSCYYHGTAPATPVPLLAPFGSFTVTGVGCYNDAHIVATHPALTSLSDTSLSNWSCSVHEAFDKFPSEFLPLVIAEDPSATSRLPGSREFPDGTHGVPYVVARGEGLRFVRQIDLTPDTATNPVGTSHTVTATVRENGAPMPDRTVTFKVLTGPNAGKSGSSATNAAGQATFTYTDTAGPGTDTIQASYLDSSETTQLSNVVTKIWGTGSTPIPPADIGVTKSDTPDPVSVGSNLTYTLLVTNHGPGPAPDAQLSDTLPAGVTFVSFSTTLGSCSFTSGTVRCSFGTLALGQTATVTIVVRVDQAGTIVNTAGVSTSVSDWNVQNNQTATAVTTAQGAFTPPAVPEEPASPTGCALTTGTQSVFAGVRSLLTVRARYDDGTPRADVAVTVRGAGKAQTKQTNGQGVVRFTVVPKRAGSFSIRAAGCGAPLAVAAAVSQSCTALSVTPKSATVGSTTALGIRIRIAGKPAVGVTVLARGAGLSLSGTTSSAGTVTLRGTASRPGVISITVPGVLTCTKRVGVSGAFQPPEVTG